MQLGNGHVCVFAKLPIEMDNIRGKNPKKKKEQTVFRLM